MQNTCQPSSASKNIHISALNGLRGLSAIAVVYSHVKSNLFPNYLVVGDHAVIFFFFQSALLVSFHFLLQWRNLFSNANIPRKFGSSLCIKKPINLLLAKYVLKRIFRIYPVFLVVLLLIFFGPLWFNEAFGSIRATSSIFHHIFLIKCRSLFWTIPIEMIFYVIAPFAIILYDSLTSRYLSSIKKIFKSKFIFALFLSASCQILFCILLPEYYYLIPTFLFGILIGFAWAEYFQSKEEGDAELVSFIGESFSKQKSEAPKKYCNWAAIAFFDAVCYVNALVFFCGLDGNFPYRKPPFAWWKSRIFDAAFFSNTVLSIIYCPASFSRIFEWNVFQYAGQISYSLYLTHPMSLLLSEQLFSMIFSAAKMPNEEVHFIKSILGIALSFLVASFTHFAIEKPAVSFGNEIIKLIEARQDTD